MSAAAPALVIEGLAKAYRGRPVLSDINLQLEAGETLALVGLNGAGKSTLLRAIVHLVGIDAGHIALFGQDHRRPAARASVAYLPERFVPPPRISVRRLLAHLCALHGVRYDEDRAAAELAAMSLDADVLVTRGGELSKGMAQKIGLVACILTDSALLLLDEPMSGLDPRARQQFSGRLAVLREAGTSVIFTTHLLNDLDLRAHQLAVLGGGRLRYSGPAAGFAGEPHDLERAFLELVA